MEDSRKSKKGGRKPKSDPCKNRYVFYLNDTDEWHVPAIGDEGYISFPPVGDI